MSKPLAGIKVVEFGQNLGGQPIFDEGAQGNPLAGSDTLGVFQEGICNI